MARGVIRVAAILGQHPGGRERRHLHAEADQRLAMGDEVVGIRHPVFLDVGPVRILGVRPPVVALGEKIVWTAGAARAVRGGDRDRLLRQRAIGRRHHARVLDGREIEHGATGRRFAPLSPGGRALRRRQCSRRGS